MDEILRMCTGRSMCLLKPTSEVRRTLCVTLGRRRMGKVPNSCNAAWSLCRSSCMSPYVTSSAPCRACCNLVLTIGAFKSIGMVINP